MLDTLQPKLRPPSYDEAKRSGLGYYIAVDSTSVSTCDPVPKLLILSFASRKSALEALVAAQSK